MKPLSATVAVKQVGADQTVFFAHGHGPLVGIAHLLFAELHYLNTIGEKTARNR